MTFKELKLNDFILKALQKNHFDQPTEIQEKSIPIFLNNQNLFGKSSTGTGKTASFVLPILEKIDPTVKTQQALIVVPTRELALQILDSIRNLSSMMENISVAGVIGGARLSEQIQKLKKSQIIVGTPGRLNDHINRKTLKLNNIKTIILDEADEMLKLGFKAEIDRIFENVNSDVQVGLFSATINPKTMQLADKYMKAYEFVEVKNQVKINENINNTYVVTKGYRKEDVLVSLIKKYDMKKAIIFMNLKSDTQKIAKFLFQNGITNQVINGDLKQTQRTKVIRDFKGGKFQVLIATDVVARGVHIDDIDYVINYELPMDDEYFVHRIGRTGRNNQTGSTISLVNSYKLVQRLNFIVKKFNLEIAEEFINDDTLEKVVEKSFDKPFDRSSNYSGQKKHNFGQKQYGNKKRGGSSFGSKTSNHKKNARWY